MLELKEIKWMLKRSNVLTVYILLPFLREKEKETPVFRRLNFKML